MQANSEIIISDTSCLILLNKINELPLLKCLAHKVYITSIIQKEFGGTLPEWIEIKNPKNKHYQEILEMDLDKGEASAIALSFEIENPILIIDELKGRKIAKKLNLRFSGTFGLDFKSETIGNYIKR